MAYISWAAVVSVLKTAIKKISAGASSLASWLDRLPGSLNQRSVEWISAYNRRYSFMLDPDEKEELNHGDPLFKAIMRFLVIFTRQAQAVSMAIRAINGLI